MLKNNKLKKVVTLYFETLLQTLAQFRIRFKTVKKIPCYLDLHYFFWNIFLYSTIFK